MSSTNYGSSIMFLPHPVPIPYFPPSCTRQRRFYLSLHPLLTPLYCPVAERSSTWTALRTDSRHRSSALPSHAVYGCPRSSSREPCLPSPVRLPPLPSSIFDQVPVGPRVLPYSGTFLLLPSSIHLTPAPPPAGLDRRPSPLLVPGGGVVFFVPFPLYFRLDLPVFCAVSWCCMKLNYYRVSFCVGPWILGASTTWRSLAQSLAPALLVHASNVRLPPSPPLSPWPHPRR